MTTRTLQAPSAPYRRLATPAIDAALHSAREMAGFPCHLGFFTTEPAAARRPPPVASLGSIASDVRMRPMMAGGKRGTSEHVKGSRACFEADELQHIRLQGNNLDRDAARASSRTRKRRHEAKQNVSDKHDIAQKLRKKAAAATAKAFWKKSVVRKLEEEVMWNDRLEEALAWDRVWELEDIAEEHALALQHATDAAETVRATGDDLLARGCELSQEMRDEEWAVQEDEARAAQNARASIKMVEDARKVASECEREVKRCARLLEVAEAAYDAADRVAARLEYNADCAVATWLAVLDAQGVTPLPVMTSVGVVEWGGVSSCDDDDDQEEEPQAKRARR